MGMSIFVPPNTSNIEESLKGLTTAADMGINIWDASDVYDENEDLIGSWFHEPAAETKPFSQPKLGLPGLSMGRWETMASLATSKPHTNEASSV
jgi:aryl-alcohol dehydrogenase-like predicted oxidoreductase